MLSSATLCVCFEWLSWLLAWLPPTWKNNKKKKQCKEALAISSGKQLCEVFALGYRDLHVTERSASRFCSGSHGLMGLQGSLYQLVLAAVSTFLVRPAGSTFLV